MTTELYASLRRVAVRHARVARDAEDLLHEALLAAASAGRLDLDGADAAWFSAVVARLGARQARDAVRRRKREQTRETSAGPTDAAEPTERPAASFLRALSPAARRLAVLAIAGMTPDEIRYVLKLSDNAYRQRLTTIRRAWKQSPRTSEAGKPDPLDFGVLRRALLDPARRLGRLGSHDPDGNLFLLGEILPSRKRAPREQRGSASSKDARA